MLLIRTISIHLAQLFMVNRNSHSFLTIFFSKSSKSNMEPPVKPSESDCCNSGCNPCIFDVYEEQLRKYKLGQSTDNSNHKNCLSLTSFTVFKVVNISKYSKDCNLYTFEFLRPDNQQSTEDETAVVLYDPGQYLLMKGNFHGETFQKAYTPIPIENQPKNQFTVLVKLYENGRMSRTFKRLKVGEETLWRGPYGDFKINYDLKQILFVAQGTGIAPFYSIVKDMLNNEECYTFLTLYFCCDKDNILLRDELYRMKDFWNFKYELFLSGLTKDEFQGKYNEPVNFSRLEIEKFRQFLSATDSDIKIYICGSESFCDTMKSVLGECKITSQDIKTF